MLLKKNDITIAVLHDSKHPATLNVVFVQSEYIVAEVDISTTAYSVVNNMRYIGKYYIYRIG